MPDAPDLPIQSLYGRLLNLRPPWSVAAVVLDEKARQIEVQVRRDPQAPLRCPLCGAAATRHGEARPRRWRDLNTHGYPTHVRAAAPRAWCREHGARRLRVPWAEPGASHTRAFEAEVLDLLQGMSVQGVARVLKLDRSAVSGIQERAAARGARASSGAK